MQAERLIVNAIMSIFNALAIDLSTALFMLMVLGAIWTLYKLNSADNNFSVAGAFTTNGFTDIHKMAFAGAAAVSTWLVFHYAINLALTEWMFTAYLGAFVLNSGIQTGIGVAKKVMDAKNATPPKADPLKEDA